MSFDLLEEYSLDDLTLDTVNVKTRKYFLTNGAKNYLHDVERVAFVNSADGRMALKDYDFPKQFRQAILSVWGKEPLVGSYEQEAKDTEE